MNMNILIRAKETLSLRSVKVAYIALSLLFLSLPQLLSLPKS